MSSPVMTRIDNLVHEEGETCKLAIYGKSGAGKTTWISHCPSPLVLLTEPQGQAVIAHETKRQGRMADAQLMRVRTWDDAVHALKLLQHAQLVTIPDGTSRGQKGLRIGSGDRAVYIQTLVLDSFTDLQQMLVDKIAGAEKGTDLLDADPVKMGFDKWGRIIDLAKAFLRDLRRLKCNVVVTMLAAEIQEEGQAATRIVPQLKGRSLPYEVGQYFNGMAYLEKREKDGDVAHYLRFQGPSTIECKPAPGFPSVVRFRSHEPGSASLGSLLLHAQGPLAAHVAGQDDDEFIHEQVEALEAARAAKRGDASSGEDEVEGRGRRRRAGSSDAEPAKTAPNPGRRTRAARAKEEDGEDVAAAAENVDTGEPAEPAEAPAGPVLDETKAAPTGRRRRRN